MIEGSYFDTPIVNLGIRQKDREHGNNVINVHTMNQQNIRKSIMTSLKLNSKKPVIKNTIYGDGNSAKKIIQLLETIPLNEKLIQKQITY
jgi:UDP-N-acetylglucosamine 2-epimerase